MNYTLLTKLEVAELLTVSIATIDRLRRQGDFTRPVMIGGALRWRDLDVQAWIDQKVADADAS